MEWILWLCVTKEIFLLVIFHE